MYTATESVAKGDAAMLDQRFFQEELPRLISAYAGENGGQQPEVELLLQHGFVFRTTEPITAGSTHIQVHYKNAGDEKRQAIVPYNSLVAVSLAPPSTTRRRTVGLVPGE